MNFLAIPLFVGSINVVQQNTNSALAVGQNQLPGWSAHRKTNNGVGQQTGLFANTANYTLILDNDLNDGQINDPDFIPGVQGQAL